METQKERQIGVFWGDDIFRLRMDDYSDKRDYLASYRYLCKKYDVKQRSYGRGGDFRGWTFSKLHGKALDRGTDS